MMDPESTYRVELTDTEIVHTRPNGVVERVALADLSAVLIETNDSGPLSPDVWWLLLGEGLKSGCVFPQGAQGEQAVIDYLLALPGFNTEMMIAAMGSTENKRFLCWERPRVGGS